MSVDPVDELDVAAVVARLRSALERLREIEAELCELVEVVDPEPGLDDEEPSRLPFEEDAR